MATIFKNIKEVVTELRALGVVQYEYDGLKLVLMPTAPSTDELHKQELGTVKRDTMFRLTEAEQMDLFNAVVNPVE